MDVRVAPVVEVSVGFVTVNLGIWKLAQHGRSDREFAVAGYRVEQARISG